jgi:hypothetical protein
MGQYVVRKFLGIFVLVVVFFVFFVSGSASKNQDIIYLTCVADPSSSMSVHWITSSSDHDSKVFYRLRGTTDWMEMQGEFLDSDLAARCIHHCHLSGLSSKSLYEFKIPSSSTTYRFRTLPDNLNTGDVKFVVGGDAYRTVSTFRRTNKQVARFDPDFVVLGGDIAYTEGSKVPFKGREWEMKRWTTFFCEWNLTLVGKNKRLIPIIAVVGNHDVPKKMINPNQRSVLFYQLMSFPDNRSYQVMDIGSYLSLFLLDTDHTFPISGDQTAWLKNVLNQRESIPYKFAAYHSSAYPSVYSFDSKVAQKIRECWSPLFENFGIAVAFEHHNHAYKRTFAIKNEQKDPSGVVYIGDGCWGVSPRRPSSKAWYLETKHRKNCFNVVTLGKDSCDIEVYSDSGDLLDRLTVDPKK